MSSALFARIYIQVKSRSLDRPFDYVVPESLRGKALAGSIVAVPFGRKMAIGVIAEITREAGVDPSRLLDIEAVLDYPPIPEPLIRLALWTADYYYSAPAVALSLVLPPGGLPAFRRLPQNGGHSWVLDSVPVRTKKLKFVKLAGDGAGEADTKGNPPAAGTAPEQEGEPVFRRTAARMRLLEQLKAGEMAVPIVMERASVSRSTIKSLAELGAVELFDREIPRDGLRYYGLDREVEDRPAHREDGDDGAAAPPGITLNAPQQQALDAVIQLLDEPEPSRRSRPLLLAGVPGAGKTEVYLRAIEEVISRGGRAIVLVPEISLTYQAVTRLRRRFGRQVGVLHSGLGTGERYDEYLRIRRGEVDVVIGPRSALFSPLPDLRLIILDEENDSSFKQENEPRYDARRAALERARLEGACLIYGSATPSLESYHLVRERHFLPERATGASLPQVEIVDMKAEADPLFSTKLVEELDRNIAAGGKSILLLNSRGFARYLQCGGCGFVWKCPNCDVSLTYHQQGASLECHHCGTAVDAPAVCPECATAGPGRWGIGTERLEQEVRRLFPAAPVFRLDSDSTQGYGAAPRILRDFGDARAGVLLGTQMVAKGHHFPEVTLAAVINADLSLQFPEFRAEERTFSLLLQLAGRSGRADLPGKVLIQTWNSDIQCIRMAADHALADFYGAELERRRLLDYPPFTSLINVLCLSKEEEKSRRAAAHLGQKLEPAVAGARLLGPANLFRLKGWHRSHILIKTPDLQGTLESMKAVIEHYREPYRSRGVRIVVDVDPQWLS
jgi:primosomal protein N' (replication factor Y)